MLLKHNADINKRSFDGRTPLHWAAANGHTAIATLLLDKGADVNVKDWVMLILIFMMIY